jgi:hypothetical protein
MASARVGDVGQLIFAGATEFARRHGHGLDGILQPSYKIDALSNSIKSPN